MEKRLRRRGRGDMTEKNSRGTESGGIRTRMGRTPPFGIKIQRGRERKREKACRVISKPKGGQRGGGWYVLGTKRETGRTWYRDWRREKEDVVPREQRSLRNRCPSGQKAFIVLFRYGRRHKRGRPNSYGCRFCNERARSPTGNGKRFLVYRGPMKTPTKLPAINTLLYEARFPRS